MKVMKSFLLRSQKCPHFFSRRSLIKEPLKRRLCDPIDFTILQVLKNNTPFLIHRSFNTFVGNMEQVPTLADVVRALEEFAPLSLGESWDNVGLLLEPVEQKCIKIVFLTNDLTEPVLEEAVSESADLIISYHPPLFRALKRVTQTTWKERIVAKCLKEGIAVYSPHTCWDSVYGGVNEWLTSGLPHGHSCPILPNKTHSSSNFKSQLFFSNLPCDKFSAIKQLQDSHPGSIRVITNPDGHLTSVLTSNDLIAVIKEAATSVTTISIVPISDSLSHDGGTGRIQELDVPASIQELVDCIKKHCGLSKLQVGLAINHKLDTKVKKIAICAGSGASVLNGVPAEVYLTGEMSHHDILEANHNNATVILTHHSNSERGFLTHFAKKLSETLRHDEFMIKTVVSTVDQDPLTII